MTRNSWSNKKRKWKAHRAADTRTDFNDAPGPVQRARLQTLDDLDKRSRAHRNVRKVIARMEADLGGAENITGAQRELIVRAAMLSALASDIESRYLRSAKKIDIHEYTKIVNTQNRVLGSIGLKRVAKDVTPSLDEYARRRLVASDVEDAEVADDA